MTLKSIKDVKKLKDKRVLVRLDLDIPINEEGKVTDDQRLVKVLPTIKYLIKKKAEIIIIGHRGRPFDNAQGRPHSQVVQELNLKPVVEHLIELLEVKTGISTEKVGPFQAYMFLAEDREVIILENIRFLPGEKLNSISLAKDLARLADIYVNESFGNSHRDHASMSAITKFLPGFAGLNLEKEVKVLSKVLKRPSRPLTLIIGGIKLETKLKVVEKFIPRADYILLGSGLAGNFYKSLGFSVGQSKVDARMNDLVMKIIKKPSYHILPMSSRAQRGISANILLAPGDISNFDAKSIKKLQKRVILPMDVVIAKIKNSGSSNIKKIKLQDKNLARNDQAILDIAPETTKLYQKIIKRSKTIIWNGPMGMFEQPPFDKGTNAVAQAVAASRGKAIIGGGDTVSALSAALTPLGGVATIESEKIKLRQNIFVSSGGGAMLEFLLNPKLPGIKSLIKIK